MKRSKCVFTLLLMVIVLSVNSCSTDQKNYQSFFREHEAQFENLVKLIERTYLNNPKYSDKNWIVLLNCDDYGKTMPTQICDQEIIKYLHELALYSVSATSTLDHCAAAKKMNRIEFLVSKPNYFPTVYYHYDYCEANSESFVGNHSEKIFLKGCWSVFVDNK